MHKLPMLRRAALWGLLGVLAMYLFACGNAHPASSPLTSPPTGIPRPTCASAHNPGCHIRLLVFSKTAAFRHASIPDAIAALRTLALSQGVAIDFTENAAVFTDANLARYNAVVFLLTTGHILDADQQAAFERYIEHGGGYAGVHSATDSEYNWSWYGQLVGAYFDRVHGHSHIVQATLHVVDHTHPSTSMLPATWIRIDEWYNFATNPSNSVHVLLTIDEKTYVGGVMGANHPIAWYHTFDGGRAWYTAMGHTSQSYQEPLFLAHLWGGILYAADDTGTGASPTTLLSSFASSCHPERSEGSETVWNALLCSQHDRKKWLDRPNGTSLHTVSLDAARREILRCAQDDRFS